MASLLGWCQASEKQADTDEIHKGPHGTGEPFIIFTSPPLPPWPGERALDHPVSGDHVEPRPVAQLGDDVGGITLELPIRWVDDLHRPAACPLDPAHQRADIALIGPDLLQAGKGSACRLEHPLAAFAVGNTGRVDGHRKQEAFGIHQDMLFADHQLLVAVVAAQPAQQRLDRLAINDRGARGGIPTRMEAGQFAQVHMNLAPGPITAP